MKTSQSFQKSLLLIFVLSIFSTTLFGQSMPVVLPLRRQAEVINQWLELRAKQVLPAILKQHEIDMWVLISREYNEDPVLETMLPAEWMSARRRTILVIYRPPNADTVQTFAIARYDVGKVFKRAWNPESQPDQWKCLAELIAEKNPAKIGLNYSSDFGLADGLNHSEYDLFKGSLSEKLQKRIVSAEKLAIAWLETRIPAEMSVYPQVVRIAHQIIREGFSEKVIQPGVSSTQDVQWWYRERIAELKLGVWFHPTVSLQRNEAERFDHLRSFSSKPGAEIIQPGDLIHVDFGITYLRLNTDTQQHAYILKPGEKEAPQDLQKAFKIGNRLQDILTEQYKSGRSGNEILKGALDQAKSEGIEATIYTHPIGYHGHGAGPTIGLWDQQGGVPGKGDYPLYPNTAYSIELNAAVKIPAWGNKKVRIMLEEDGFYDGKTFYYIDGRQTEILLIPRDLPKVE